MKWLTCHEKEFTLSGIQELLKGTQRSYKLQVPYKDEAGSNMENELEGMRLETGTNRV